MQVRVCLNAGPEGAKKAWQESDPLAANLINGHHVLSQRASDASFSGHQHGPVGGHRGFKIAMSLIFLALDYPPSVGGIQTVSHGLPLALHEGGERVGVVSVQREGAAAWDATVPYPVLRVPGGDKLRLAAALAAGAVRLHSELGARPRAVIATKWFPEGLAGITAAQNLGAPLVLLAYGREFRLHGGNPLKWLLQRRILSKVNVALAISRWTACQLARAGVPCDRIRRFCLGIDPAPFLTPPDTATLRHRLGLTEGPVLLTVGRLVARKGHLDVIGILPELRDCVGPVNYVIAGTGPMEAELRTLAAQKGVAESVFFAGSVPDADLPALYHLCDVFVMPTVELPRDPVEGFGLVYLEANAAGKPVVGTACGGVPDAIQHGVSGLLIPPQEPEALLEALHSLLTDRDLAARLGHGGRQRVLAEFTWQHSAQRFLEALAPFL
jgi:phosphatidylinositol alpha-1,6-mannosyltransferase